MATLTITLTEAISLGDGSTDRGTTNTQTITGIDQVDHRILDLTTSFTEIIKFGSLDAAGTFKHDTVRHLRITNLDSTNFVNLRIRTTTIEFYVKIESEGSNEGCNHFLLSPTVMDANSGTDFGGALSFANITSIEAKADTADVQIEYFVACS